MLLQALHVETEMKNINLQVTLLGQKGVGISFSPLHYPLLAGLMLISGHL